MSVGEGLFKTVQILRGTIEQSRSSALGEITKKSISRVDAVLEDLEIVLNTRSPGFAKTPAVILIDDAQFSTEDPGLADFCEKLLHMAMTQKWPLMILVTHWKRDLSPEFMTTERSFAGVVHHARTRAPHENGPVAGLPGGYLTTQNMVEIDLAPVPDLTEALYHALPGLLPDQAKALLEHAGGNPRHLEQIIAFLRENEEFFEHFETANALTEEGLREALEETHDILKVVMRRLRDAPVEVQEAICLASLQGMRFVSDIVNDLAKACLVGDRSEALEKAVDPFSMVSSCQATSIAEFSERLFYLVAEKRRRSLKGLSDTATLTTALQEILRERMSLIDIDQVEDVDGAVMTFRMAAQVFAKSEPAVVLNAVSAIVQLEQRRYGHGAAVSAAEQFYDLFTTNIGSINSVELRKAFNVACLLQKIGRRQDASAILIPSMNYVRSVSEELSKHKNPREIMLALAMASDAFWAGENFQEACQASEKMLDVSRYLAGQVETSQSLRDLTFSLEKVGEVYAGIGKLPAAAAAWRESLQIRWKLAKRFRTLTSLRDLAESLSRVQPLTGDYSFSEYELAQKESLQIIRDLATELQRPDSLRDLWLSLGRYLEESAEVRQERLEISRHLAAQLKTPQSLHDLSISLKAVGAAASDEGDVAVAEEAFRESLSISRALSEILPTPSNLLDLAVSLTSFTVVARKNLTPAARVEAMNEAVRIMRDLDLQIGTSKSLFDLSSTLRMSANAQEANGNLEAAQQLREEAKIVNQRCLERQAEDLKRYNPWPREEAEEVVDRTELVDGIRVFRMRSD
jgi:tetratricopeptide (TPR) repeat protein